MKLVFVGSTGPLPTHIFHLLNDQNKKIGMLQIRARPSRSQGLPENFASHVYYEIEPAFRNHGYGKEILRLGLSEAKKIGLLELILTVYADNVASKKIIEANGRHLLDEIVMPDARVFLKYRINLR